MSDGRGESRLALFTRPSGTCLAPCLGDEHDAKALTDLPPLAIHVEPRGHLLHDRRLLAVEEALLKPLDLLEAT